MCIFVHIVNKPFFITLWLGGLYTDKANNDNAKDNDTDNDRRKQDYIGSVLDEPTEPKTSRCNIITYRNIRKASEAFR